MMYQQAPYPDVLADLVNRLTYRPGWSFQLFHLNRGQGSEGLTFCIYVKAPDTNDHTQTINVVHYMIVPAAAYNAQSWRRWLFEQILLVERHEAAEFFRIDGEQPYAPNHGQGNDPYVVFELTSPEERSKTYRD